jgi:hypothetical protein
VSPRQHIHETGFEGLETGAGHGKSHDRGRSKG